MFGAFGFFVQFTLGILSFMVLISIIYWSLVKRLKERPRRPWKIWFLVTINNKQDVSKQGFSSCVAHLINLILAVLLSEGASKADQCIWYFINISVDTIFGVLLCYIFMYIVEVIAKTHNLKVNYCILSQYNQVYITRYMKIRRMVKWGQSLI